jgi:hypothetical protein
LIVIAWLILLRIRSLHLTYKVRKLLDEKGIDYDYTYDELTDEHYAQIRDVLVTQSSSLRKVYSPGVHSSREGELIRHIERILVPSYTHNLSRAQKIRIIVVYFLAFALPLIQWAYLNDWI